MIAAVMTTAIAGTAWAEEVTDVIDNAATSSYLGNTGTTSWGTNFDITGTSGAVYRIHSMGTKNTTNALQWNANGYLYMSKTPEGYKLKSVTITTTANKNIGVYAQNTAYTQAPSGTALSTLAATSSGATYTFTSDYTYLALKGTQSSTSITNVTIVWEKVSGGSSPVATTTTINASGITNTDVYAGTDAGTLTASVTAGGSAVSGATVTWTSSDTNVATINASGVVTLVAAGTTTITASYAGVANQYQSSSATYELTVTDSTPFTGSIFIFNTDEGLTELGITKPESGKGTELVAGEDYTIGNVTMNITHGSTKTRVWNSNGVTDLRVYSGGGSLTFTVPAGYAITKVTFTGGSVTGLSGLTSGVWTASGDPVNTVTFSCSATSKVNTITVEYEANTIPIISANDLNIAYDATSGSITYSVTNPVTGGTVTATSSESWLTPGNVTSTTVPFTCDANTETTARTATVTLTYTYNTNETVTKDVTITQAAAPVIYSTIPAIFAAATSTATDVYVNFGGWVVSGVKGSNAYLTDNQGNGLIIYASDHGFQVGDVLTGIVSCKLQLYHGSAELMNLTSSTEGLSVAHNGTVTEATIAMADLAGVNTGALVSYSNLTCSVTTSGNNTNYDLTDGTTTIRAYTTLYDFTTTPDLEDGKTYNIKGIFLQYTTNSASTKEILPRSAADIEEVVVPSIAVDPDLVEEDAEEHDGTLDITYENLTIGDMTDFGIQYYDAEGEETSEPDWIEVLVAEAEGGEGYVVSYYMVENEGEARTAYFKVFAMGDEDFVYSNLVTVSQAAPVVPPTGDQYELFRGAELGKELEEGDYLIVYDGAAMSNVVTSDRLKYEEVTAVNDVITTDNAAIVWHIAPSDRYWTIYNADANAYAASTGVKNKAQMLADGTDDKALWTVDIVEDGYDFINKYNADRSVNAYLRNNKNSTQNYGFACYAENTGGALSLYKKVEAPASQTVTVSAAGYATFVAEADLEIPADVEVFAVTINDAGTSAHLTAVTSGIPEGEAVLVRASADTYEFPYATGAVDDIDDNDLVAATSDVTADGTQYCLAKKDGKPGFYQVQSGIVIPAGKAYLVVPSEGLAKSFYGFDEDDATGIETIENGQLTIDNAIFNVAGQRMGKMQKGINIVNGKKVLK